MNPPRPAGVAGATGPAGAAGSPPPWLAASSLPIVRLPRGTTLFRVHQNAHGAVFFGPPVDPATGRREPPAHRFDSQSGNFGVLYGAAGFEGAFAETVLRNPQRRFVSRHYIRLRAVTELACDRDLRLVDFCGRGLSAAGLTNAISTGPYAACQAWSDFLWSHADQPDGIAYRSRHNPEQICYAVFERPNLSFTAGAPSRFAGMMPTIAALLRQYGKIPVAP